MKNQNQWLDTLIAALKAKEDHRKALTALIAHHGNKRTEALMHDLLAGIRVVCPETKAVVNVYMGQFNLSFPGKGAGYDTWRDLIMPHLPRIKAATTKRSSKASDPVASYAKRIMRDLSAAQRRRLVALVG